MGLDTVELIVSLERYFCLELPDSVAETIYTIDDLSTWLSQQLSVPGLRQSAARVVVAAQLLSEAPPSSDEATPLRLLLPNAAALKNYQYVLKNRYGLVLPPLSPLRIAPVTLSLWERLTGQLLPSVPHWSNQTLSELIDWTVASNYEKLLRMPLTSQYEVEQVVVGMTSDKSGVPVEEIHLQSSFTNDLGMD
jgi:acyl carrier protein